MKFSTFRNLLSALLISASSAHATSVAYWQLPMNLSDENTKIKFEVDTTWHIVYGNVSGITGKVEMANAKDPTSIKGEIQIPVKNFSTGWDARDKSLLEHMKVEKYPEVQLKINGLKTLCTPAEEECKTTLLSSLRICDVTKEVEIDAVIKKMNTSYEVSGNYPIKWAEYNVDDPSILVAKVDPTVTVSFSVQLNAGK